MIRRVYVYCNVDDADAILYYTILKISVNRKKFSKLFSKENATLNNIAVMMICNLTLYDYNSHRQYFENILLTVTCILNISKPITGFHILKHKYELSNYLIVHDNNYNYQDTAIPFKNVWCNELYLLHK